MSLPVSLLRRLRDLLDGAEPLAPQPDSGPAFVLSVSPGEVARLQYELDGLLREPAPQINPGKEFGAGGVAWSSEAAHPQTSETTTKEGA